MRILVFDSGLGGLTVHAEVVRARPDAEMLYLADDQVFPYGRLAEDVLIARVAEVILPVVERQRPDLLIIACNTASTLVLPDLRSKLTIPVIGTVPAIKPAAEISVSRMFTVLATPGTVARDYTRSLIDTFAADCAVTLVGSHRLAVLAEASLRGEAVSDAELLVELDGVYVEQGPNRTDVVVLACTHYPLLGDRLNRLAPWPVTWIDPGPAIARRVVQLAGGMPEGATLAGQGRAMFTSGRPASPALVTALAARGLVAE